MRVLPFACAVRLGLGCVPAPFHPIAVVTPAESDADADADDDADEVDADADADDDDVPGGEGETEGPSDDGSPAGHVPGFGADATLLYATDYTNRDERASAGGMWSLQYPDDDGQWNDAFLAPVAAPWDPQKRVIRATIHAGDDWEGFGYPRSELSAVHPDLVGGTRYFLSFGFAFPPEAEAYLDDNDAESLAALQLHHPEPFGPPPLAIYLTRRSMELRCMGGDPSDPDEGDWYPLFPAGEVPVGRRVAIDIDYLPRNGPDGHLRLFVDGVLVADHQGACAYTNDGEAGYLKQGLYDYDHTVAGALSLFLDDLTIRAAD